MLRVRLTYGPVFPRRDNICRDSRSGNSATFVTDALSRGRCFRFQCDVTARGKLIFIIGERVSPSNFPNCRNSFKIFRGCNIAQICEKNSARAYFRRGEHSSESLKFDKPRETSCRARNAAHTALLRQKAHRGNRLVTFPRGNSREIP